MGFMLRLHHYGFSSITAKVLFLNTKGHNSTEDFEIDLIQFNTRFSKQMCFLFLFTHGIIYLGCSSSLTSEITLAHFLWKEK